MPSQTLIELQPRSDTVCISQSRTVLITGLDGFVDPHSHQGTLDLAVPGAFKLAFLAEREQRHGLRNQELKDKLHVIRQPSPWSLTAGFGRTRA